MNDRNLPVRRSTVGGDDNDNDNNNDQFLDDPLLPAIYRNGQDGFFSLGLVVNWPTPNIPSPRSLQAYNATNYERFLSAVKTECFRGRDDFLFCLPFHTLHITIASLFSACEISQLPPHKAELTAGAMMKNENTDDDTVEFVGDGDQWRLALATEWKHVLLRASSSDDWPKRPLELELDSAQIRNRAGVLLWKEGTGGIAKMRHCLEVATKEDSSSSTIIRRGYLRIPDIIHTTFVRYHHREGIDNDDAVLLRPSQAHSALIERVLPNQALFSKTSYGDKNDDVDIRLSCQTGKNGSTDTNIECVVSDVARLVDCKIYLLGHRKEDHEIFISLPLQDSKQA